MSPSNLSHEEHEGTSAVRSGGRGALSSEVSSVLHTARDFAAMTAKSANKGDWVGWLQRALGTVLGGVSKFSPFVMLAKSIVGVIDKIIDYSALKDCFSSMDAKNKADRLSETEDKVFKTAKYAVAKVKRGMFEQLAFFVGYLDKVIVHLITLLSGGTTPS